jgi:hypothetical protein
MRSGKFESFVTNRLKGSRYAAVLEVIKKRKTPNVVPGVSKLFCR